MEISLKNFFPGLAAKREMAKARLYDAEKTYENVVQYHNHGAGNQNAMDYDDEINNSDVDIGESKDILMARSRDEFMGNAIANGAIKRIRSNVVGVGIKLKASIDNNILGLEEEKKEEIEKNIENLWRMWSGSTECDWGRQSKLSHIQSLAILTSLIDGECFAALSFKLHPGELFGLKVRLLDPASCINPSDIGDKDIKNGVEKDKNGIITAYHFKKSKDGSETTKIQVHGSKTGRKNLLVLMDKERIGQRRGIPLIAPVLEILHQMRKFTHAELMAATINSYFTAFVENENQETKTQSPFKPKNGKDFKLKSGAVNHMAPGQKIVFPDSNRPNSGFTKFMETMCVHLGAALELAPEQLLLKFSNNYSASKGALLESWKMLKTRRQWFTDDFMQPIYEEFLDYCVAMDYIDLPGYEDPFKRRAYQKTQWFGQAQGSLDPLREAKAAELRIKNNLTTSARESMEINGSDIDDNIEQRGRELKKVEKMSLLNARMQGNKTAEIRIYGVIGEGWSADVTSEDINRELDALGDVTEISVRINSPGGGVFAGCAIYNSLKRHKAKIIVYIDGVCASIATVPAMAGDVIVMSRAAMMMVHNPYFPKTSGGAKELRKKADDLDKFKEVSIGAYLTKVNITRDQLIEKMDYETWMNADEAKEYGFITEIENDNQANMMAVSDNMLMCGKDIQLEISKYKNLNSFLKKEHLLKTKPVTQSINIDNLNNKGDEKMNFEQFKQKYPDLFKQAVQVGVTSERSRIQNLETIEQRAGRSLECIQKAKFETPVEATNEGLMGDVLQEMATQSKNAEIQPKAEDKMKVLLNKIDDAKAGGVQERVLDGMTKQELEEKQEADEIDDIVALANGEE